MKGRTVVSSILIILVLVSLTVSQMGPIAVSSTLTILVLVLGTVSQRVNSLSPSIFHEE